MARILIVDDSKDLRLYIATELPGHSLTICAEGFEALEEIVKAFEGEHFDLMIFDCVCPNINGFTLSKIVRLVEESGLIKRTKIALMSSYGSLIEKTDQVKLSGADFYWRKPEELLNLRTIVDEMFKK